LKESIMSTDEQTPSSETAVVETDEQPAFKLSLNVDIQDAGPCRKKVAVRVPRTDLDHYYGDAMAELESTAEVKGFRVGHVPRELLAKRFRKEMTDQVKQKVLLDSLEQLEADDVLDPINQPDIDIESLVIPDAGDFEYSFEVEVRPKFDIPEYTGLTIEKPVKDITEEAVDNYQKRFLSQFGNYEKHDGPAQEGDFLRLDGEFFFNERSIRRMTGQRVQLKPVLRFQDAVLENFGELLAGVAVGDSREVGILVSQEAESLEMRGETVHAKFTVREIERHIPPELTPGFLEEIEVESVEDLRGKIRETLERQVKYEQRQSTREQVLGKIPESANWDLPEDLVRKQVDNALRREILEMQQAGFTRQQIQSRENELRQNAVSNTKQALKEHFVLDKIATKENIQVGNDELDLEIQIMAMQQGESARKVRARLVRAGMMENLEAQIRERKAVDVILDHAQFKEVPMKSDDEQEDRIVAIPQSVCGVAATPVSVSDEEKNDEADDD
jgi:trigger factor